MAYRYTLSRRLEGGNGTCLFVMLNPSTADAWRDDPTITRCRGFASRLGYARLRVVNLFALRATDPSVLYRQRSRTQLVGSNNDRILRKACRDADLVIAAWGNHGSLHGRSEEVRNMLPNVPWHCLGLTLQGQPRHPGRIPNSAPLQRWP